jgi:hypothetical protein
MPLSALIALLLGTAPPGPPERPDAPPRLELGEATVGGWSVQAWTEVNREPDPPEVQNVACEMERDWLQLRSFELGGLAISFGRGAFDSHRIRRLVIDRVQWEYRWVAGTEATRHFTDLVYPRLPEPPSNCGLTGHAAILYGPCIPIEYGARQVRRPGTPHWFFLDVVAPDLVAARSLRVGYRDEDDPPAAPLHWKSLSLSGLDRALAWCRAAVTSARARRLHPPAPATP